MKPLVRRERADQDVQRLLIATCRMRPNMPWLLSMHWNRPITISRGGQEQGNRAMRMN